MRKDAFEKDPEIVTVFGPGPFIVTFSSITSSALVNVMLCPCRAVAKLMLSPSWASASAWRNEPGPSSLVFVTVMAGNGRGGGVGGGLGVDEPTAPLLAWEAMVGCPRIAAAQTSKTPITANRIAIAFVLI
jgi:hypothetical protein